MSYNSHGHIGDRVRQGAVHQCFGRVFPRLAVLHGGRSGVDSGHPRLAHQGRAYWPGGAAAVVLSGRVGDIHVFVLVYIFSGLNSE